MKSSILTVTLTTAVVVSACGSDNSRAVKAHSLLRPGMTLAQVFDIAEQGLMPDLLVMANPKDCSRRFQIGRRSGPRYIRVISDKADPRYPVSGYAYKEEGFASREAFLDALERSSKDFLQCKTIVLFLMRYQGGGDGDANELKFDDAGKVASVGPLEFAPF
jgi:hypothetical protein